MSVPSFSDLGKSARDVFKTGYHYGKNLIQLNVKAKSGGPVDVCSDLRLDYNTSKLTGVAEAAYRTRDYGALTQKWTTDGTVFLSLNMRDTVLRNVGLQSEISYNPGTTAKSIKFGTSFRERYMNAACSVGSDMNSNYNVLGSLVTSVKGLFIGYQGSYNSESNQMTKNDFGMAYCYQDVGFHFRCTSIPHEYGLSVLYKVTPDWHTAINGILARKGTQQIWTLGAATKCQIDERSTFRCKFNSELQLGLSLQQKIDENVKMTLSFNVDCANVARGGHKVGLAIEIDG